MSKGKLIAIILAVCGGIGLSAIAICSGMIFAGYRNVDNSISPKIDALFATFANEQYTNFYANETTPELRKVVTEEQFVSLGKTIDSQLGRLKVKSLKGYFIRRSLSDSFMDVSYEASFEKSKGTINATLKKSDGEWKFVGFRVNSPVFQQSMQIRKCPTCEQECSIDAKFCPACGVSLANNSE